MPLLPLSSLRMLVHTLWIVYTTVKPQSSLQQRHFIKLCIAGESAASM